VDTTHRSALAEGLGLSLDRRTFLGFAATGLAAAAWPTIAFGQALGGDVPMSLGYLAGSDGLANLRQAVWRRKTPTAGQQGSLLPAPEVVPATSLLLGDQQLAGETVRVRIAGLYPRMPRLRDGLVSKVDLMVDFTGLDEVSREPRPFYPWSLSLDRTGRTAVSPPIRFTVPLGYDSGLRMSLQVTPVAGLGLKSSYRADTLFTVDSQPGFPRLQRGHYLLGFLPGVWDRARRLPAIDAKEALELTSLVVSVEPVPKS
jgi:hypothetical protein